LGNFNLEGKSQGSNNPKTKYQYQKAIEVFQTKKIPRLKGALGF
jgi:hypothetical protein